MKTSPGLAPVAVALACGTSGFDPSEDTRKVFDVALGEGIEEMASDRRQVGGCGGLEHGGRGVVAGARRRLDRAACAHDCASAVVAAAREPSGLSRGRATIAITDASCAIPAAIMNASCSPPTWAARGVEPEATRSLARCVRTTPANTAM